MPKLTQSGPPNDFVDRTWTLAFGHDHGMKRGRQQQEKSNVSNRAMRPRSGSRNLLMPAY